jgi:hypothetical protein
MTVCAWPKSHAMLHDTHSKVYTVTYTHSILRNYTVLLFGEIPGENARAQRDLFATFVSASAIHLGWRSWLQPMGPTESMLAITQPHLVEMTSRSTGQLHPYF